MLKIFALLPVLAALAVGCADNSSPEEVTSELKDVSVSHDCAALKAITAPDVRSDVECNDRTWGLIEEVSQMIEEVINSGGTFQIDPDDQNHAVLPFACRGTEFLPCYFDVVKVDGTWYIYDLI